jgi:hypothetical protein
MFKRYVLHRPIWFFYLFNSFVDTLPFKINNIDNFHKNANI